ncbi:MAG TPA: hypothetical protein VIP11_03225 [Gemmatimonadaceae bacterium]
MHKLSRVTSLILMGVGVIFGASCNDLGPRIAGDGLLVTDSVRYTATAVNANQVTLKIVTRYRNPSDTAVELSRCFPDTPYPIYYVELIAPSSSEGAGYNPAWGCVGHNNEIVVAPHAVRTDTITLNGPTSFSGGRFYGVLAGTFRLYYGSQGSSSFTIQLPPGSAFR